MNTNDEMKSAFTYVVVFYIMIFFRPTLDCLGVRRDLCCMSGTEPANSGTETLMRLTLDISMNLHNDQYKDILNGFQSVKD